MSESEDNKGTTGKAPDSEGAFIIPSPAERLAAEATEQRRRDDKRRKLQLVFNCVVAITGAVTVGVLVYQATIMQGTLTAAKISADASAKNADAARRAADSAEVSAKVASSALEVGERAYMTIDTHTPEFLQFAPDRQLLINVRYVNRGRSPATQVSVALQQLIISADNPELHVRQVPRPKKNHFPKGNLSSRSVAGPEEGGFATAGTQGVITSDEFQKIKSARLFICVHGKIFYRDIFEKDRSTEFCFIWLNGGAFAFCSQYNNVD